MTVNTETRMYRNQNGWKSETNKVLPPLPGCEGKCMVATISTRKSINGGIVSTLMVQAFDGMFTSHRLFHDFRKDMDGTSQRCTEKAIASLHAESLANWDRENWQQAIFDHYAKKAAQA